MSKNSKGNPDKGVLFFFFGVIVFVDCSYIVKLRDLMTMNVGMAWMSNFLFSEQDIGYLS